MWDRYIKIVGRYRIKTMTTTIQSAETFRAGKSEVHELSCTPKEKAEKHIEILKQRDSWEKAWNSLEERTKNNTREFLRGLYSEDEEGEFE